MKLVIHPAEAEAYRARYPDCLIVFRLHPQFGFVSRPDGSWSHLTTLDCDAEIVRASASGVPVVTVKPEPGGERAVR